SWRFVPLPSLVLHLLGAATNTGNFVAVITGWTDVVEVIGQLAIAASDMHRLDEDARQRDVRAAAAAGVLIERGAHGAFLGVVHDHRAFGNAVGDNCTSTDYTVAVVDFDPFVVRDTNLLGILIRHPHDLATTGNGQDMQVVKVLRVYSALVVGGQISQ